MPAVSHGGNLALRRPRTGLVLEQLTLRRAYRHPFRRPIHWISGRDRPNNATDTLPAEHFIAPACVIDCSGEAAADADFLLTVTYLKAREKRDGRIPPRSWVLMRTDWSKRSDPVAYQNLDDTGQHTPAPTPVVCVFW